MMTTNKNQRTTHIDDVVKYQARPFFHSHCSLCDMRLFLQLFMHAFYIRRWKWWNYSHLHLHALSLLLSLTCFYISFHVFYHFSIIFVAQYKQFFIFSRHTLFYPIVPLVQNYVSRQKFKTYTRTKQKKNTNEFALKCFICIRNLMEWIKKDAWSKHGRFSLTIA